MNNIRVEYSGDELEGLAREQVSLLIWAHLRKQDYANGSVARVRVWKREQSYYLEAMAKEPNGPPLRLMDLELPLGGATEEQFDEVVRANGLGGHLAAPDGTTMVGVSGPSMSVSRTGPKIGRNDPCPCGSGKKFKKCCQS